jgi:predicted nucleic acid-binding protein
MEASLDTNVIIHLYQVNMQDMLFTRFAHIYVHEQISTFEMVRRASSDVLAAFRQDIDSVRIEEVTNDRLNQMGILSLYRQHYKDNEILYNPADKGEVCAIALARTLGISALITDDIKEYGPHFTLISEPDTSVFPFAFYELLFFDYLENILKTPQDLKDAFETVNQHIEKPMNFQSKQKGVIRRFFKGAEKDKKWMEDFCSQKNIHCAAKLSLLHNWMRQNLS